ncbi:MAG: ABC transporter ATP-binding protein [Thermodesulfobacteriota bacterium]
MTKLLEVRNLKTYFKTPEGLSKAVDGVSFHIERGETFALVGESGCGKSLTALSIMQLVPEPFGYIAEGEILLDNKNIIPLTEPEKRKIRGNRVSMIFQEPMTSLNPVFTIGEQIMEAITLHQGKTRAEAKTLAIEMLEKVKLPSAEALVNDYPHRLSGGMRQRVMIAMALACRPDVLIADEPTTALDVTIQEEILALIEELKEELKSSVFLITHNMALVHRYAARVAVMYAGKIVEQASAKTLFKNPLHPYTIKLLSAIPGAAKRGKPLDTIPGAVPAPTDYPDGCRFSGRCRKEMAGCASIEPLLMERETGHLAACHLHDAEFMKKNFAVPLKREPGEPVEKYPPVAKEDEKILVEIKGLKTHFPIKKGILKKTIGHVKAVDGIDLSIKKGQTLALVGESGCGKTTAGKTILRLIESSGGKISFDGKDITRLSGKELLRYRRLMQIIFQDPYSSLNPRMKAGDIIEEGLKSLKPGMGRNERTERVIKTLGMVGLGPETADRYPHEFSGGQRQRIGIARAIAVEPEFLICDEATSSLDVSVQAQILNLLKAIQREFSLSFLFITHDLAIVEYMADEVAVMFEGKIVERGTVEKIFSSPEHPYTKKLLASVPRIDE